MTHFGQSGRDEAQQRSSKSHQDSSTSHYSYPNLGNDSSSGNGAADLARDFTSPHASTQLFGAVPQEDMFGASLWPGLYGSALEVPQAFEPVSDFLRWPGDGSDMPQMSMPAMSLNHQPQPEIWAAGFKDLDRIFDDQRNDFVPEAASSSIANELTLGVNQSMFHQTLHALNEAEESTLRADQSTLRADESTLRAYGSTLRPHTVTTGSSGTTRRSPTLSQSASSTPLIGGAQKRFATATAAAMGRVASSSIKRRHTPNYEQATKKIAHDAISGEVQGTFMTLGKRTQTRQPLDEEAKKHASFVRQHGGQCDRCKRLKVRCKLADNPYECCDNCKTRKRSYKIPRMPCFQSNVTDALFFRSRPLQDSPIDQKRAAVYELRDFSMKERATRALRLVQEGVEVEVFVAEFQPTRQDRTAYEWKTSTGGKNRMELPPFCLTDIPEVNANLRNYAKQTRDLYLAELSECHPIAALTVDAAITTAGSRE